MEKRVKYCKPDVITYSHHAFPLGIILTQKNAKDWYLSNYLVMYFKKGMNALNFLVNYDSNPFVDMRNIYKTELDFILKSLNLRKWIEYEIDNDFAIEIMIDYYYLPNAWLYNKEHFMHEILIVGYDNNMVFYWDYIKGEYKEAVCNWNNIVLYNSDVFYGDGVAAKLYNSKKGVFKIVEKNIIDQIEQYYNSFNPCGEMAIWGDYSDYSNYIYGRKSIESLILEIKENDEYLDFRYFNLIYEHKNMMLKRAELFMKNEDKNAWKYLYDNYADLVLIWRKLTNFAIKYILKNIKNKKDKDNILDIMIKTNHNEEIILANFLNSL